MKNFFKLTFFTLLVALVFAGCADIMGPPAVTTAEQGLQITIANGIDRTLYPTANFTKYVVSFSGPGTKDPVTITTTTTTVSGLAAGQWTITVTGYVNVNLTPDGGVPVTGEFPAAEGTQTVTVGATGFQTCEVKLSAGQDQSKTGYFSYNLGLSAISSAIYGGYIALYQSYDGGFSSSYDGHVAVIDNGDTTCEGAFELDPGFYLMVIQIYDKDPYSGNYDYQCIARTEAVHIYSDMETKAAYTFAASDFLKYVTIGGTASVKIGGDADNVREYSVFAYMQQPSADNRWEFNSIASVYRNNYYNGDDMSKWEIRLAAFEASTPIYLLVEAMDNDGRWYTKVMTGSVSVFNSNVTNNTIVNVDFTPKISVSGSVLLDGSQYFDQGDVVVYSDANYTTEIARFWRGIVSINNNWASFDVTLDRFLADTHVYFEINFYNPWSGNNIQGRARGDVILKDQDGSVWLVLEDPNKITLSGTVAFTGELEDNEDLLSADLLVFDADWNTISYGWVNFDNGNRAWEIQIPKLAAQASVYVQIEADVGVDYQDWGDYYLSHDKYKVSQIVPDVFESNKSGITITIPLGKSTVTGTIGTITMGGIGAGQTVEGARVLITEGTLADRDNGGWFQKIGWDYSVDTTTTPWTWSIEVLNSWIGQGVNFVVDAFYQDGGDQYMGSAETGYTDGTVLKQTGNALGNFTINNWENQGSIGGGGGGDDTEFKPADTTALTAGQVEEGTISGSGSAKYYTFTATQGEKYNIWIYDTDGDSYSNNGGSGSAVDVKMHVYTDDGSMFDRDIDQNYGNNPYSFEASDDGTIYVKVVPYGGGTGSFQIKYAKAFTPPVSQPMSANQWYTGSFSNTNTEQWYSFSASNASYYIWINDTDASTEAIEDAVDVKIELYSNDGTLIQEVDRAWTEPFGDYTGYYDTIYVRVCPYYDGGEGNFAIAWNTSDTKPDMD